MKIKESCDHGTAAELGGLLEQIDYHIAHHAYFVDKDFADAYWGDLETMRSTVQHRHRRDERVPNNPLHGYEEPIRAGYEAACVQIAKITLGLMDDFCTTLRNPNIEAAPETTGSHRQHAGSLSAKPTRTRGKDAEGNVN